MSRKEEERLQDILEAITAIRRYLQEGDLTMPVVFDAVRMRFIDIGEAVKSLRPDRVAKEAAIPWRRIAGMRDRMAHSYFDTAVALIEVTVTTDLDELEAAIERLLAER